MMMLRTATLTLAIAAVLGILGPGLDDHSDDYTQLADIEAARQTAAERKRFEHAAQALCGPNAAWRESADGSAIQCFTKRGHRAAVVVTSDTPEASP